jgi:hypothetical protein
MLTSEVGRIDWGYFAAAALMHCRVSKPGIDGRFTLRAIVVNHDAFKLCQRPLVFILRTRRAEWRWRLDRMDFDRASGVLVADMTALPDAR